MVRNFVMLFDKIKFSRWNKYRLERMLQFPWPSIQFDLQHGQSPWFFGVKLRKIEYN